MSDWYIRLSGDDQNGGGYDGDSYPGGSNLANADAAALSVTDLASTTGTSVITSATGGFTASMIGNAIRIKSGTNFTPGFYWITAVADTNTATVHADPTNGSNASGGTARVGGAWGSFHPLCASDAGTIKMLDGIACPFVALDRLLIEGSGVSDPTDIDYPFISGAAANLYGYSIDGCVVWEPIPGTGTPYFQVDGFWYLGSARIRNCKIHPGGNGVSLYGRENRAVIVESCTIDNRGDFKSNGSLHLMAGVYNCRFVGGGGGVAVRGNFAMPLVGCEFTDWGPGAVNLSDGVVSCNLFKDTTVSNLASTTQYGGLSAQFNVFDNSRIDTTKGRGVVVNNVFTNIADYGFSQSGTGHDNRIIFDNNAWYNVTGSKFSGNVDTDYIGANNVDLDSDPFVDADNGDYSPSGTALRGLGFPASRNFDIGPVQSPPADPFAALRRTCGTHYVEHQS